MKLRSIDRVVEVTKYQTTDGKVFDSLLEATAYQAALDLERWYKDTASLMVDGYELDWFDLVKWIKENEEKVLMILGKDYTR